MNFGEFAKEVHQNAVDHGWYDTKRDVCEIFALIHSEWSEALEEYRAGRPMKWYHCCECDPDGRGDPCTPKDAYDCLNYEVRENCPHRGKKPEGIAVELIDGCIRILDFAGAVIDLKPDAEFSTVIQASDEERKILEGFPLPTFIAVLHIATAHAMERIVEGKSLVETLGSLNGIIGCVFAWLESHGREDPKAIMLEKHEYNKKRPYRHGGKRC